MIQMILNVSLKVAYITVLAVAIFITTLRHYVQ